MWYNNKKNLGRILDLRNSRLLAKHISEKHSLGVGIQRGLSRDGTDEKFEKEEKPNLGHKEKILSKVTEKNKSNKCKCIVFNPFLKADSYFEKNICKAFCFKVNHKNNMRTYDFSLKNITFSKIISLFVLPVLFCILGNAFLLNAFGAEISLGLLFVSVIMIIYIFIKFIKYVWVSLKKR
ncbi:Plasmodium exported protein (Pm-fam-a like), unknown function [Plasmodium ovale wallikeri]|uniref:Uncharacterized protein n=1 Tax=Plasmodium ovale wallikeri TaxID=864142 RepID=A0A1A9ARC6_PLAOA|nr:Plasmodium exported protein (Pm-fam-a like), unknown function [Plasmodium ovale wallikeri]